MSYLPTTVVDRQQSILRAKWADDYATHTRKGTADVHGYAQFAEV